MITEAEAELFGELCAAFGEEEVKTRTQSGRTLHYITARTAMNRFDNVLGPANWWDDYEAFHNGAKCKLSVRLPDGTTVTKSGVGGFTEMHDPSDTDKTGESDAFKRAAVKFGVGRYLYRDGVPYYLGAQDPPAEPERKPEPPRPNRAPQAQAQRNPPPRPPNAPPQRSQGQYDDWKPPRSNKGMYPWLKHVDASFGGALKRSNAIAKEMGLPFKSNEWDDADVETVAWTLIDDIKTWENYEGQFEHLEDPRLGD